MKCHHAEDGVLVASPSTWRKIPGFHIKEGDRGAVVDPHVTVHNDSWADAESRLKNSVTLQCGSMVRNSTIGSGTISDTVVKNSMLGLTSAEMSRIIDSTLSFCDVFRSVVVGVKADCATFRDARISNASHFMVLKPITPEGKYLTIHRTRHGHIINIRNGWAGTFDEFLTLDHLHRDYSQSLQKLSDFVTRGY